MLSKLYRTSPYEGFDRDAHPVDPQGWGFEDTIFGQAIAALQPSLIIEVGSWKGMSAIRMGRIVKALELNCEIVCVDTWLGSPEHLMAVDESWYEGLRYRNGYPQLFFTFMSNVMANNLQDTISPFPATSENAAYIFEKWGIKADLIYIDAAHEYDAVKADIKRFWPILSDDGLMILDDYLPDWSGVVRAVDELVAEKGMEGYRILKPGKAVVAKSANRAITSLNTLLK